MHIFNPDHDLALASGLENFTSPHAGRQLRHDLGWLPALWAKEGDVVLVDDEEQVRKGEARLERLFHSKKQTGQLEAQTALLDRLTALFESQSAQEDFSVEPWGWNMALRALLIRKGVKPEQLPTPQQLAVIRQLSHRRTSAHLLSRLHQTLHRPELTGEAEECHTMEEVELRLQKGEPLVLKAPWSSSGRGVRFVCGELSDSNTGWLRNILANQGSVMVEPLYNKVRDFGMEFRSDGRGHISYMGLSLFHTHNGAYTGNLLATENHKRRVLSRYLPMELLDEVKQAICLQLADILGHQYTGLFGIDMMIVTTRQSSSFILHPCVEINLRRTMGHVALRLTEILNPQEDDDLVSVMRIAYEDNTYKLRIQRCPVSE